MEPWLIAAVIVLFVSFLLWNGLIRAPLRRKVRERLVDPEGADDELRDLLDKLRQGAQTRKILEQIKKRVAGLPSPHLQAAYLCSVGDVLKSTVSRRATAVKYYIKALKADPTCAEARFALSELLLAQRRGFKLEQIYWKLLSRMDLDACPRRATLDAWEELCRLLERRRSGKIRAKALRHLISQLDLADDDEDEASPDCGEDEPIPNG